MCDLMWTQGRKDMGGILTLGTGTLNLQIFELEYSTEMTRFTRKIKKMNLMQTKENGRNTRPSLGNFYFLLFFSFGFDGKLILLKVKRLFLIVSVVDEKRKVVHFVEDISAHGLIGELNG